MTSRPAAARLVRPPRHAFLSKPLPPPGHHAHGHVQACRNHRVLQSIRSQQHGLCPPTSIATPYRWRLRAGPPGVLVKFPGVVGGNALVFLAVPYTALTGLGRSRPSLGPGRRSASWPNGPARTVRRLSGIWSPLLPAPLSGDRAAAFHEDESAAFFGDRRPGSTAAQPAVDQRSLTVAAVPSHPADDILGGNPGGPPAIVLADPPVTRTARPADSALARGPLPGRLSPEPGVVMDQSSFALVC